jgi:hypothetical protein
VTIVNDGEIRTASGYEGIYKFLLPKLAECDIAGRAERLGVEAAADGARVSLLGRNFMVTRDGVTPADGGAVEVNARNVIIYYILSDGTGEPACDFAPLNRLAGTIDGQSEAAGHSTLAGNFMSAPLVKEFGSDSEKFSAAMTKLGGIMQPSSAAKKHAWHIRPMPKILMQIVLYEADDEFPADFQIMFDRVSPRYLDFECLAALASVTVNALVDAAKRIENRR